MEIDNKLRETFPEFSELSTQIPIEVEAVQRQIKEDEALVYFVNTRKWENTPDETFIWLVTKKQVIWVKSDLGTIALNKMVQTLRCGLDSVGWQKRDKAPICARLLKVDYSASNYNLGQPLPFDTDTAFKLYKGLFGKFEQAIKNKKLLIVPSGPLTSLPFQVMLKSKPVLGEVYSEMDWLVKSHNITVLPSVSSLKALRQITKPSKAKKPYLGVGNPLLVGPDGNNESAWTKQNCNFIKKKKNIRVRTAGLFIPEIITTFFRGGLADLKVLKYQLPLPETADEVCYVAENLNAKEDSVKLVGNATESNIKKMSLDGDLKDRRILHFATHGLLSGETKSLVLGEAEPALILSPPNYATKQDDGLLTASEIAQLKLDADWVILSACNTAAGGRAGSEALSGLAKSFFYAGGRSLLVSHWYVNSDATVKLITQMFNELSESSNISRAEALRRSMLKLIRSKQYSHPEYWAPFIIVGAGS